LLFGSVKFLALEGDDLQHLPSRQLKVNFGKVAA
jgi:hypothetical protein